jgi:hypothetical protein
MACSSAVSQALVNHSKLQFKLAYVGISKLLVTWAVPFMLLSLAYSLAGRRASGPLASLPSNIQDDDLPMLDSQATGPSAIAGGTAGTAAAALAGKAASKKGRSGRRGVAAAGGGGDDGDDNNSDEDMQDADQGAAAGGGGEAAIAVAGRL